MQDEHQKQMEQARRKTESQVASLEAEHKKHVDELRRNADARATGLEQEHGKRMEQYKKQLEQVQQTAKSQAALQQEEHLKQLEQARKTAEADADRVRHRAEADMADLKATISRLEVDLMKVSYEELVQSTIRRMDLTVKQAKKTKVQEIQAIKDELDKKLQDQANLTVKAESRVKQLEKDLGEIQEKAVQVCNTHACHPPTLTITTRRATWLSKEPKKTRRRHKTNSTTYSWCLATWKKRLPSIR